MRTMLLAVLLAAACDHSGAPALGAPCECETYPCLPAACGVGAACFAGTCAIRCASDADCPDGAVCNSDAVRSCEYPCATADECPAGLDRCDGACYGGPLVTE